MSDLRLVVFDVDGTLIDSQGLIVASMADAFGAVGLPCPPRAAILSIVGLSLPQAMTRLVPDAPVEPLVEAYKDAFSAHRQKSEAAPLYPGARAALESLAAQDWVVLGVATGKSRRGLDAMIEAHGLEGYFVTRQVADDHPSKPHPSMLLTALAESGAASSRAVMVGDTSFDMQMAADAGIAGIGVTWGYHPRRDLHQARVLIDGFGELGGALDAIWGPQ